MKLGLPVIALFLFTVVNLTIPPTGPGEYVGHWIGTADGQVSFTLDIELDGTDLSAKLNGADMGMVNLEADWVELSSDHSIQLSFDMPDETTLLMRGELNDEGSLIGRYEMGEQAGTFTANKKKTKK